MQEKRVSGWDDPRMPTLSGMRRRGFTPEAIRTFCRHHRASRAPTAAPTSKCWSTSSATTSTAAPQRAMAVLRPLKLVIDNYPEGQEEFVEVANNPEDPSAGTRQVPFSREIYIEQDDFREVPPPKYYRLSPGKEVRLRNAYFITAQSVVKDRRRQHRRGALHLRSGQPRRQLARWPQGQVHHALGFGGARHLRRNPPLRQALHQARSRRLRRRRQTILDNLNPNSLEILTGREARAVSCQTPSSEDRFQFERVGYFCLDPDSTPGKLVFNRTLPLKDSWAKIEKKAGA